MNVLSDEFHRVCTGLNCVVLVLHVIFVIPFEKLSNGSLCLVSRLQTQLLCTKLASRCMQQCALICN